MASKTINGKKVLVGSKADTGATVTYTRQNSPSQFRGLDASITTITKPQTTSLELPPQQGEPSVLSSENGIKTYNGEVSPYIDQLNNIQKQAMEIQQKIKERTATENTSEKIPDSILYEDEDPVAKVERLEQEAMERQERDAQDAYDNLVFSVNQSARAEVNGLKGIWSERKQELQKSNRANEATWEQQFIRTGQAEYSPGMTSDFLTAKEKEGLKLVQDLDNKYNSAIAQVNALAGEKKFAAAADLTKTLREIEDKMLTQMRKNAEEAKAVNAKYQERAQTVVTQSKILDLVNQGFSDPADILNFLNFDEDGIQSSNPVTVEDINDTLKIIGSNLTGATADLKTFALLYPELKVGTPEFRKQYEKYVATSAALKRKPGSDSPTDSPASDEYGELVSFDEFKRSEDATRLIEEERQRQLAETGKSSFTTATAEQFLRPIYEEAVKEYKRNTVKSGANYTAGNIPGAIKDDLMLDISKGATLQDLYNEYTDVSTSYISSLYNSLQRDDEEEESDEDSEAESYLPPQ